MADKDGRRNPWLMATVAWVGAAIAVILVALGVPWQAIASGAGALVWVAGAAWMAERGGAWDAQHGRR